MPSRRRLLPSFRLDLVPQRPLRRTNGEPAPTARGFHRHFTLSLRDVVAHEGVVTLDMGPNWNPQAGPIGALAEVQVSQVKAIRNAFALSPSASLERYRADLAAFRQEYGGAGNLPDVPFFQFGMGLRTKYLFKKNVLLNARSGTEIHHWDGNPVLIVPPEYLVSMTTSDGRTIAIREDEEAVWIEEGGQRRALEGTRKPIHLPRGGVIALEGA